MRNLRRSSLLAGLVTILICCVAGSSVRAAPAGGITIAPAKIDLSIPKHETQANTSVTIKNTFAVPVALHAAVHTVDTSRGMLIPGARTSVFENTITALPADFELAPGETKKVQILIKDASALKPGGNYAALLVRQHDTATGTVSLTPAISVSLFITKEQGAVRQLASALPKTPKIAFKLPTNFTTTFNNTGNVLLVPRGSISISRGGTVTHKTVVNESSVPIFPGKTIRLQNILSPVSNTGLPGPRTITYTYRYDGAVKDTETLTATFWYLPWWSIAPVLFLIIAIIWGIKVTQAARRRREKRKKRQKHYAHRAGRQSPPAAAVVPSVTPPAQKQQPKPKVPIIIKDLEPPPSFTPKTPKPRPPKKISITD